MIRYLYHCATFFVIFVRFCLHTEAMDQGKILVIDDDPDILLTTKVVLKKYFAKIITEADPGRIFHHLEDNPIDILLLDMNFSPGATSGKEGLDLLERTISRFPDILVIMITAYGDIDLAVQAMKIGAIDFIVKPWENRKLLATVQSAFRLSESKKQIMRLREKQELLRDEIDQKFSDIIGSSEEMIQVFEAIRKVGPTDANVLILGENGTGKELVARSLHKSSQRASEIFIPVDLGSIHEALFESEMFGHMKGSFTDAREDRKGRFEIASGGTLFLDEIGNLSLQSQAKLLTAIQNRTITPVGSNEPVNTDIRLICATNTPIFELVNQKGFREDLLYRINTVELHIPPLRERTGDIPLLVDHFMMMYGRKYNKAGLKISPDSMKKLSKYKWPGNVRELQHVMERAIILSESNILKPVDFLIERPEVPVLTDSLNMEDVEKQTIINALQRNRQNITKAAEEMGMARTTLYRKMKRYDL